MPSSVHVTPTNFCGVFIFCLCVWGKADPGTIRNLVSCFVNKQSQVGACQLTSSQCDQPAFFLPKTATQNYGHFTILWQMPYQKRSKFKSIQVSAQDIFQKLRMMAILQLYGRCPIKKDQNSKASKFQPKIFFSLNKRFSKASKCIYYLFDKRAS